MRWLTFTKAGHGILWHRLEEVTRAFESENGTTIRNLGPWNFDNTFGVTSMGVRALLPELAIILLVSLGIPVCHAQAPTGPVPASAPTSPAPPPAGAATGPTSLDASKQAQKATTAVNNAASTVSKASDAVTKAGSYTKTIQEITGSTAKSTQSVTDNLQTLQATIDGIQQNKLLNVLTAALKDLDGKQSDTVESGVNGACDPAQLKQPSSGDQQDVTDALANCGTAQKNAATTLAAVAPALTGLQTAMQSISPYMAKQFDLLTDKLKPFADAKLVSSDPAVAPPGAPDPVVLLQVLPKGLPALREALNAASAYQSAWNNMKAAVQSTNSGGVSAPAASKDAPDADAESKKLQTGIESIETKLGGWFAVITTKLSADAQTLDGKLSAVASEPAKNSADALGDVREKTDTLSAVQFIVDAWPPMVGFLVDGQPTGFSLSTTKTNFEILQKSVNVLRASISRVHDALAGDFTDFETDQVSLYYFSDVARLMYALNDRFQNMGGVAEAKAQADAQRTALTQTELDLADAQATVNRYQKQVLDLQEEQRQANEKLKGLNSNLSKLASRLKQAQDSKAMADTNYDTASKQQNPNPATGVPDPTLNSSVDKAKAKQTADAAKLSDAQSNYDAAKAERDKAQAQADDAQNQKDSLPAKLAVAQQAMSDAQVSVSQQRRKMLLAAQAESDAFAFARDNTPFMFAPADASSPDPAKRVILYAFNDNKTIFMRGKPQDLSVVKHMIAVFDKPAPQARLTLWTFQLSADSGQKTNKKAAGRLNESMEIVDQELGDTRALENTALAWLRDVINSEVARSTGPDNPNCKDLVPNASDADCEKLRRIAFYDTLVLRQLNFDLTRPSASDPNRLALLRKLIPDPADTTTLGEALLALSLAPPDTRNRVRNTFEQELRSQLGKLPQKTSWRPTDRQDGDILPLTWHALGIWQNESTASSNGLSSAQLEIVRALRASYDNSVLSDILKKIEGWRVELGGRSTPGQCPAPPVKCPSDAGLYSNLDSIKSRISTYVERGKALLNKSEADTLTTLQVNPDVPSHDDAVARARLTRKAINLLPVADQVAYDDLDRERLSLESRLDTIKKQSVSVVNTLRAYGIDAGDLLPSTAIPDSAGDKPDTSKQNSGVESSAQRTANQATAQKVVVQQSIAQIKERVLNYAGLSTASPRVAAADEMLKEIIIAVEDDLSRDFVQPMIKRLRIRLMTERGVGVGVVQRESLLATNRGVARIDPRASTQLAVGDQEDILSGIQQLAQLYATVQSGGALAALGALQQQPREPRPEIYALNTGNKFQVTPIFDPSGQALRFKFDFVATANLQEPNGTMNTQMARIERHTINTEVQLSNLETREISRFEVNARLGLPTTYWGGIPVLKDIPHVRPWVPLIGWFVRKGGSNASAQQSVIFGQTTIYPTIGALIELVSDPGNVPAAAPTP